MIEFKDITIEDRELLEGFYNKYGGTNSEANFTNMFIWQKDYNIKYAVKDGFLLICAGGIKRPKSCHFPIGEGNLKALLAELFTPCENCIMRPLTEDMTRKIEEAVPGMYRFERMREADDYVYSVDKLSTLSGKKLHSKRNHYNYFINNYNYSYHKLTPDMIDECHKKCCEWTGERSENPESEKEAMTMLFENYEKLNVVGGYILCDGQVAAVSVGEKFHGNALIHIEKANTKYRGIYPAINKLFLENEFSDCNYVNREEDLGLEGLRKAKLSYYPEFMIEKYTGYKR